MSSGTGVIWPSVVNLANSIIGVSVLAMPYCFKECGIILGPLLLLFSSYLTRKSCHLLLKAGAAVKRRSYEFLALHSFGPMGKLGVELCTIGLMLATCVGFFVIIGDLAPPIVSQVLGVPASARLRVTILIVMAFGVALPLGLLRKLSSLTSISSMSFGFYFCLVIFLFAQALPNLFSGQWTSGPHRVAYWRPSGVIKSFPIFALAFACQTQLFPIYDTMTDPSLKKMLNVVDSAINMVATIYLSVGFFGLTAFYDASVAGDILLSFRPSLFGEAIKMGFVLSVAVSFPLVIFPCRLSINSLIWPPQKRSSVDTSMGDGGEAGGVGVGYIPPTRFKGITLGIVASTLIIGINIPGIEAILGLVGSTVGVVISFIFPSVIFLVVVNQVAHGEKGEKTIAKIVLCLGLAIMLSSTYTNLAGKKELPSPRNIPGPRRPSEKPALKDTTEKVIEIRREPPVPHAPMEKEKKEDANDANKDASREKVNKVAKEDDGKAEAGKVEEKKDKEDYDALQKKIDKAEEKHDVLLQQLVKQQEQQKIIMQQQNQIIEQLKSNQDPKKPVVEEVKKTQEEIAETNKVLNSVAMEAKVVAKVGVLPEMKALDTIAVKEGDQGGDVKEAVVKVSDIKEAVAQHPKEDAAEKKKVEDAQATAAAASKVLEKQLADDKLAKEAEAKAKEAEILKKKMEDAAKEAAARLEAAGKVAAAKLAAEAAVKKEADAKLAAEDAARKEFVAKEAAMEAVAMDAVAKQAAAKIVKDAEVKKVAANNVVAKEAAAKEDAVKKEDAAARDTAAKEAAAKEVGAKEAALKEAALKEAALKEAALKESALKEAALKEAAIKEALAQAAKEAALKEALVKEAAIKITADLAAKKMQEAKEPEIKKGQPAAGDSQQKIQTASLTTTADEKEVMKKKLENHEKLIKDMGKQIQEFAKEKIEKEAKIETKEETQIEVDLGKNEAQSNGHPKPLGLNKLDNATKEKAKTAQDL